MQLRNIIISTSLAVTLTQVSCKKFLDQQPKTALTQEQVDQVYIRLTAGPIGDGPYRGDLFFPRDADGHARISDVAGPLPGVLGNIALLRVEDLGRALWKGKVSFRSQGVLRNRIDDLAISETDLLVQR